MSEQCWWEVTFTDGTTERVYGEPRHGEQDVLTFVERYGVTGGVKTVTNYSLSAVRKWVKAP